MRRTQTYFHHLDTALDIALGIRNSLTVFASEGEGEFVVVLGNKVDELHQHAGPALRVGRGPSRLSGLGVLHGCRQFGLRGKRHAGGDFAGHRPEHIRETTRSALDLFTADEMVEFRCHDVPSRCWVVFCIGLTTSAPMNP